MKLVHSANPVNTEQPATNKHEWLAAVSMSSVSHAAVRVASVLWRHMKFDGSDCFPSIPRIATCAQMSEATAMRARRELRDAGLLDWHGEYGHVCTYTPIAKEAATPVTHDTTPCHPRHPTPVTHDTLTLPLTLKKRLGGQAREFGRVTAQSICVLN